VDVVINIEMFYTYKARDKHGQTVKGEVEAADPKGAIASLRESGVFVSVIKPKSHKKNFLTDLFKKTALKDRIIFTQQLGIMIRSGLSVVGALEALSEQTGNKTFAEDINQVISDVKGGMALSDAFAKHERSFDSIYVNTVRSGEKTGKLDEVLLRLTVQLEKDYDLNKKIRGAMVYPAFIMIALIAVMVLVLIFIIPQLKLIFDETGVPLPALTRAVIALSEFLQAYVLYVVIGAIGIYFGFRALVRTPSGRLIFDKFKLKIPVFGNLLIKTYMAKFSRTFAGLSAAGLPLLEIFKTTQDVVPNLVYQNAIANMAKKVESGEPISKVIRDYDLFPKMMAQLASVGEKSGSIDEVFDSMANFFDKEVENITSNLSTLLEPMLMVVMGGGVGLLIVSVLQPIYGLVNAI